MKENRIQFDNKELLRIICDTYDYEINCIGDKVVLTSDGEISEYDSIELALIDWLPTLVESEIQYIIEEADISWIPEINQIKEIKNNLKYNGLSTSIKDTLVYGEVPKEMHKNISVFLDEQTKKVNNFIKMADEKKLDIEAIKASLPIEFVLENEELKYIKIANLDFVKRLLKGDTSEIECYEVDVYNNKGRIVDIPFISLSNTKKFEINVPIVLTLKNNYLRLQTPIHPLYLI